MAERTDQPLETDPRFPSGAWTGFFLQPSLPGKHRMELLLTFRGGMMTGEGRDWVGEFLVRGEYALETGHCHWTKSYIGKHDVLYRGFNEGKGIWGVWEIPDSANSSGMKGGFHIWPEGDADPSYPHLAEALELPQTEQAPVEVGEPMFAPAGLVRRQE